MLGLIKKDLMVSLRMRSLKSIIGFFILILLLFTMLSYTFPTLLPIVLTYIFVMNSFYYDSLNKSEMFILSLPTKREDVVYSKYILTLIVLFTSIVLMYILFGLNLLDSARVMVLQDVFISIVTILFAMPIVIGVIFKYGYRKGRIVSPFIMISIGYLIYINNITIISSVNSGKESFLISICRRIGAFIYNIFNLNGYDYMTVALNIYFIITCLIALIIFISAMYFSLKIYKKKDIA